MLKGSHGGSSGQWLDEECVFDTGDAMYLWRQVHSVGFLQVA